MCGSIPLIDEYDIDDRFPIGLVAENDFKELTTKSAGYIIGA